MPVGNKAEQIKQDLAVLKFKRDTVVKKIKSLFQLSLEITIESDQQAEFDVRCSKLESHYESFCRCQGDITKLSIVLDADADLSSLQELIDQVDEHYFAILATKRRLSGDNCKLRHAENGNKPISQAKLPKLSLPTFSGAVKDWPHFKDLFMSLVHENGDLTDVERFQYLRSSLSGDPLSLAHTLPATAQNYSIIWEQLVARYDDKRRLASFYLEEIVNLPMLTTDSPKKMRQLLDTCTENSIALKSVQFTTDLADFMLFHTIVQKLDKRTRQLFESKYSAVEFPTLDNLLTFVRDHCKALDASQITEKSVPSTFSRSTHSGVSSGSKPYQQPRQFRPGYRSNDQPLQTVLLSSVSTQKCLCCEDAHLIYACPKFLAMPVNNRRDVIKSRQGCFNCLSLGHMLNKCGSKSTCRSCGRRHHTLLHFSIPPVPKAPESTQESTQDVEPKSTVSTHIVSSSCNTTKPINSTVLLGTAIIHVGDTHGQYHVARALIDPGSQVSFATESFVNRLSLPRQKFIEPISGICQSSVSTTKGKINCLIKSTSTPGRALNITAVVLPKITAPLPTESLPSDIKDCFKNFELADPTFHVRADIDFLLGAELYSDIFDGGRQSIRPDLPTLHHSIFGWVLIGSIVIPRPVTSPLSTNLAISESQSLETCLKQFWEIEEGPGPVVQYSPEEQFCEQLYATTHERNDTGRYVVRLPFKPEKSELGESYNTAFSCLMHLERRFERNPNLLQKYQEFMSEYESLGHMRPLKPGEESPKYLIPHHAVFKEDSYNSKLRVVFNASAKTTTGVSLNEQLLVGPKLQADLCQIINRFRLSPVVFVTDICKMYRQILVHPDDQAFQAILWRPTPNQPVLTYILQTVTYGVSSAPYLAIRTIKQLAQDEANNFPSAAQVLVRDCFVDDLLVGCESLESAQTLKSELINLLKSGGLELKKWASNSKALLSDIPEQNQEIPIFAHDTENQAVQSVKVLGIKWVPSTDSFSYNVTLGQDVHTKRSMLSVISRLFDPLGWVAPVLFSAKVLMQQLWLQGIGWDDIPNQELLTVWKNFLQDLPYLQELSIPRFACIENFYSVELHGFCDASLAGYAAVLFLRTEDKDGQVNVRMVTAKSKVAPIKPLSVPRLELCGALLLSRLLTSYKSAVEPKLTNLRIFAWTDSLVTLSWVRTPPHCLKMFVANRVVEIQDSIEPTCWNYTPTNSNPADLASRGMSPRDLINHSLWWNGPDWLHMSPEYRPPQPQSLILNKDLPDVKPKFVAAVTAQPDPPLIIRLIETCSSFTRLKRIVAYVLRFKENCKKPMQNRTLGAISANELTNALLICVKVTQQHYFSSDLKNIQDTKPCTPAIQRLDPYVDENGVLRVGGRLRHSSLQFDARHPMLLPKEAKISHLIIDYFHLSYFHIGPRTLQALLHRQFWIFSARRLIRSRISKCVTCAKFNNKDNAPFMANLPSARTRPARPFIHVGVDFGGPFTTKTERLRKPQMKKSFLCLFVCMATKALHLEVVSDLTTEAFLAAFNRMIARRGHCSHVYSDRGTNFVGAANELQALVSHPPNSTKIQDHLSVKGITWHFNPPHAPNFGGIWEAGIKSAKYHLKRVVGAQVLTFEELSTFFIQVEALLNSRPLCPLSPDTHEIDVLTPGHFLIGEPLIGLPQPDYTELPSNRLSRWQLLHQLRQHFWRRWSHEYLHSLQQRTKWNIKTPPVAVDDLVLVKEANLPPQTWKMGRIISTHPGPDGIVRVVKLRTPQGVLTRPVSKLCPLPTQ